VIVRILLAALRAMKGDVAGNLRRHVELLELARSRRCDLAVFPEFSLTGSVDPGLHPEQALAVDAAPVRQLVAASHRIGAGAVFGIAERAEEGCYISQLYAHGGRLAGRYRKRHLGEGEEAYRTGVEEGVFRLGAARFGIAICAEGGVDLPWAAAATAGAPVVFFCSAPGLYGRRTDEAGWRRGHEWWESHGLGDAVRHARRYGLWVAMATQAGSAQDEDFPGLAALVTPNGEVAHRLPDWRPGELVVEVPVEVMVRPVRPAARALVVDDAGRTLLVRFVDEQAGTTWWCPPGGGLEDGEDHLHAVRRELTEELGRDGFALGPWIGEHTDTFQLGQRWMTQQERWILCRTAPFELDGVPLASLRAERVHEVRWWTADEIRSSGIVTAPRGLADLLGAVNAGRLPNPEADLGV
jgi:predicted amidohydrolase/predicted NUDIX family NTP pyrophosphohydrolase